jgi:nickel-type superoxide dismutase maturation protease
MRPGALAWALLALLVLAIARRRIDVAEVRGRSMAPTLLPGDRLVLVRPARSLRVGDVVVAPDPRSATRELIKRVAAFDRFGVTLRGDNPAFSTDARTFGTVPPAAIGWRVAWRYWPRSRFGAIATAPVPVDDGGESACAVPEALLGPHRRSAPRG